MESRSSCHVMPQGASRAQPRGRCWKSVVTFDLSDIARGENPDLFALHHRMETQTIRYCVLLTASVLCNTMVETWRMT